jgi:hypothetical protein
MGKVLLVACRNDDELQLLEELGTRASSCFSVGEVSLDHFKNNPRKLAELFYYLNCMSGSSDYMFDFEAMRANLIAESTSKNQYHMHLDWHEYSNMKCDEIAEYRKAKDRN